MEISKARELLQVAIIRKKLQAGICEIAEKLIMSSGLSSRQVVDTLLDYEFLGERQGYLQGFRRLSER